MIGEYASHATELDTPILVAVDGSASSYQAAAWAAVEAVLHHRRLHILTSMAIPTGFGRVRC
ncbi:universal stress protein [Nocardia vinacea]|uniref:universal stress protein n=1 Tax=Nocardia vinacea TaxID=96468 RepID=UPI0033FBA5DA